MMDNIAGELTAEAAQLLMLTKIDELAEQMLAGELSPQDATQAVYEYNETVADGTAVNNITPRQRELLEERELKARVQLAMAEAEREYRPLRPIPMNLHRVYPD